MPGTHYPQHRILRFLGVLLFAALPKGYCGSIDHARITEVVNDVNVIEPASRKTVSAKSNDLFQVPDIMKTGAASRSEMVAEDQTITRVGADTLFSFEPQERTINLKQGSVLFQSPTGKGGGNIRTASATASVLGTTIIVVATKDGGFKLLVLEGTGWVRLRNHRSVVLHAGQMIVIPPGSRTLGPVLDFLLSDEVRTSLLVHGFKRPLPSWDKIRKEILAQEAKIASAGSQQQGAILGNIPDSNTRINEIQVLHGQLVLHER